MLQYYSILDRVPVFLDMSVKCFTNKGTFPGNVTLKNYLIISLVLNCYSKN